MQDALAIINDRTAYVLNVDPKSAAHEAMPKTVCQLTGGSRGNGGGLRPRVWLRLRAAVWGQLDPGWNLTIGRRSQFLLVLGHMKAPKDYFVRGCFPKIEWAPAYVDPGARRLRMSQPSNLGVRTFLAVSPPSGNGHS